MAVKRGEVWTVSGGDDASKPRPAVILQAEQFNETLSVTLVPCTTDSTEAPLLRLTVTPDAKSGLRSDCRLMVDKITTGAAGEAWSPRRPTERSRSCPTWSFAGEEPLECDGQAEGVALDNRLALIGGWQTVGRGPREKSETWLGNRGLSL
jgi:mRNA-degrading endonuclease toxin of MazEF toxin-antitoxin module